VTAPAVAPSNEEGRAALAAALAEADLAPLAAGRRVALATDLAASFVVDPRSGEVRLGPPALASRAALRLALRHGLELALQLELCGRDPVLAGLVAARTAALFAMLELDAEGVRGLAWWYPVFAAAAPPPPAVLKTMWADVATHQPGARTTVARATAGRLADLWPILGPAEHLMGIGGDVRLRLDPETGLNQYGCSSRPRSWAVTFASSTASSISERGYAGAERGRRRLLAEALEKGAAEGARAQAERIRRFLVDVYGLPGETRVVLTPSGTDAELAAVAVAILGAPSVPLTNVVLASEETGSGVPLAVAGRHFATLTARGAAVNKGAHIEGFPGDLELLPVRARTDGGRIRPAPEVNDECARSVAAALDRGRRVLLHLMDQSKTGVLALADVDALGAPRKKLDVVVDSCQARLAAATVRRYLERGFMVSVTGSKFFTGPPFSGALLLPPTIARRLDDAAPGLPRGLAQYFGRYDWPESAAACACLAADANVGLNLRWEAALAEMRAFAAVDPREARAILDAFARRVGDGIRSTADLLLHDATPPQRADRGDDWDTVPTIFTFSILRQTDRGRSPLGPEDAHRVYVWLNSDLSGCLPARAPSDERALASRQFHIGQPVTVLGPSGQPSGALRISAGARLVSGEPSLAHVEVKARLAGEIEDALGALAKISLILRHWDAIRALDPRPRYAPPARS
jgi:hypothetical protein